MYKIVFSALLLACVAFILLPDVSQATSEHNLEILRQMQPLLEELLKNPSLTEKSERNVDIFNKKVRQDLANPSRKSLVVAIYPLFRLEAKRISKQYLLNDEAKKDLEEIIKLLGHLSKDED